MGKRGPVPTFKAAISLCSDVTETQSLEAAAKKVDECTAGCGLNLLINNAGIACDTTLDSEDAQSMAAVYATNTIGPMLVTQVRAQMQQAGQTPGEMLTPLINL